MKGTIYHAAIAMGIFSRVKITCYFHMWGYHVFAQKLTWHFIGVYIVKYHIHYPGRMRCYCQLTHIEYICGGKLAYLKISLLHKLTLHSMSKLDLCRTCLDMVKHRPSSLIQSPQRKDFEGGVHLGIGGFNLVRLESINQSISAIWYPCAMILELLETIK